jgi:autotransporter-associated beta strand protein
VISGTGSVRVGSSGIAGSGTQVLTLSGANTYSGGTSVNAGSLNAVVNTAQNSIGTGAATIATGTTLQLNNTNTSGTTVTIGNSFSGAGTLKLNLAAGGTATNTIMNNVNGMTGTIQVSNTGTTGDKWSVAGANTTATVIIDSGSQLFSNTTANTFGSVRIIGTGNTENRGAIRLSASITAPITLLGNATIGTEGGTISGNITSGAAGTQTLTLGATGATTGILSGIIGGGTGTIAITNAAGENQLSNTANSYSGGTQVNGGFLRVSDRTIGTGDLTLNGGTLFNVAGSGGGTYFDADFGKQITLTAAGGLIRSGWGNTTISGKITSSGAGALTIVNDGSVILSNNTNDYAGNTVIGATGSGNNATLVLGADNVLPNGTGKGNLIFNSSGSGTATLNLNGRSETINGLSSSGAGSNVVDNLAGTASYTLTVGDNNQTSAFAGIIRNTSGTLALTKIGTGFTLLGPPAQSNLRSIPNGSNNNFPTVISTGSNGIVLANGAWQPG